MGPLQRVVRGRGARRIAALVGVAVIVGVGASGAAGQESGAKARPTWPGLKPAGEVLLPNGWSLRPAGRQSTLGDFPVQMALHPSEPILAVLHAGYGDHEVVTVEAGSGRVLGRVVLPETFAGLAWSPDGTRLFVGGGTRDVIERFDHAGGLLSNKATFRYPADRPRAGEQKAASAKAEEHRSGAGRGRPGRMPAGIAVTPDGKAVWVANAFGHSVARFDAETGELAAEVALGDDTYPYGVALDPARKRVYVSLWGAAKVAVVEAGSGKVAGHWESQEHPNEILLTKDGKVLYVANANRNTVSVFDAESGKALETIGTAIAPDAPPGSTPSSLALTPDEKALFVVNANTNDVAAINVEEPGESKPLGFIPTGWYPTSVRVSRDGKTLYVANGKGATSKANREGPNPVFGGRRETIREYIGGLFQGTLSTIPLPDPDAMGAYTKTVYRCSPLRSAEARSAARPADNPVPAKVGDPSPITHCVYIIKENRTYDQVFGDMPEGNGEPSLCLFPEEVTPNHHALAREFVLLDNFYVDGEVSADGHEWTMGAYASDFVERLWPLSYRGNRRVPYPSEGAFKIAEPAGGYLWDRAKAKGVTYRSYGEFIANGATPDDPSTATVPALEGHFDPKFRGYDLEVTDVSRAKRFLEDVNDLETKGELPRLIVLRLPNDHTAGTVPGKPTPTAMVADNDLALGLVVEGLGKTKAWKSMAIFVVEDDAQNGADHVDAHRTVALAISPYSKRNSVDSTLYSTSSMLRTMELILGLDPMSQFDAAATPMWASFRAEADATPYAHRPARVDLKATNTATAWGAEASLKLDLEEAEDRADDLVFNEIIWKSVKGADSPMPPPVRAAFVLPRD